MILSVVNSSATPLQPGYSYVTCLVPVPALLSSAVDLAGEGAIVNAFAGFPAQLVNSGQKRRKDIGVLTQGKGHRIDVLGGDLLEAAPGQAAIGEALEEVHHIGG